MKPKFLLPMLVMLTLGAKHQGGQDPRFSQDATQVKADYDRFKDETTVHTNIIIPGKNDAEGVVIILSHTFPGKHPDSPKDVDIAPQSRNGDQVQMLLLVDNEHLEVPIPRKKDAVNSVDILQKIAWAKSVEGRTSYPEMEFKLSPDQKRQIAGFLKTIGIAHSTTKPATQPASQPK